MATKTMRRSATFLKLPSDFEATVKALLATPPPPKGALPERPKAKRAAKRKVARNKSAKKG